MLGKASTPAAPRGKTTTPVAARSTSAEVAQAANATPPRPPKTGVPDVEAVRTRAYALWERAGQPEGDGVEFWLRAEQELSNPR